MADKIAAIKGMDSAAEQKLIAAGITTVDQLVEKTRTPHGRGEVAKQAGVTPSQLTEWINRADLMRLKGVGTELAYLLEECGVDSCKELQHRHAENLQAKLKSTNDEKHITHHAPPLAQVQAWIKEAATLAAS